VKEGLRAAKKLPHFYDRVFRDEFYGAFMARHAMRSYDLHMFDTVFNGFRKSQVSKKGPDAGLLLDDNQPLTLLNAREAAAYLRVSLSTLHRMERRGQLRAMRTPGGHRRYTLAILNHCLENPSPDGSE
jgi:excisionase family DNA binding protein